MYLQAFDDKPLVARILYLFAKLSYAEAQYGQTVNLCLEAQVSRDLKVTLCHLLILSYYTTSFVKMFIKLAVYYSKQIS